MAGNREHVKERIVGSSESFEIAAWCSATCAQLGHGSCSADRWDIVADRAARAVERWTETFLREFNLEKIVESEAEFFELDRRDARKGCSQRVPRLRRRHRHRQYTQDGARPETKPAPLH